MFFEVITEHEDFLKSNLLCKNIPFLSPKFYKFYLGYYITTKATYSKLKINPRYLVAHYKCRKKITYNYLKKVHNEYFIEKWFSYLMKIQQSKKVFL